MSGTYGWCHCRVCNQQVSADGAAWVSHMRKHVREGKIRPEVEDGRFQPAYGAQHRFVEIKTKREA